MPVENTKGVPFKGLEDIRCLRYPDQGAFHPLKYLQGLAAVLKKRHMRLCSGTVVEEVVEENGGVIVKTQGDARSRRDRIGHDRPDHCTSDLAMR